MPATRPGEATRKPEFLQRSIVLLASTKRSQRQPLPSLCQAASRQLGDRRQSQPGHRFVGVNKTIRPPNRNCQFFDISLSLNILLMFINKLINSQFNNLKSID
jgi:hypothetical protein